MYGRITDKAPYGVHISVICMDHPHLRWSTKNIGGVMTLDGAIGFARSLFFEGDPGERECPCSGDKLRLHPSYADKPSVPE
jgi:hypothetical protein